MPETATIKFKTHELGSTLEADRIACLGIQNSKLWSCFMSKGSSAWSVWSRNCEGLCTGDSLGHCRGPAMFHRPLGDLYLQSILPDRAVHPLSSSRCWGDQYSFSGPWASSQTSPSASKSSMTVCALAFSQFRFSCSIETLTNLSICITSSTVA